jgi:hypothetical protein
MPIMPVKEASCMSGRFPHWVKLSTPKGVVTAVMVEAGFRGGRVLRLARGLRLRRAAQQTECCLGGGARRSGEEGRVYLI